MCKGNSSGNATVEVSGGVAGYTYSWAPRGGTNAIATGLQADQYVVTVTDANQCNATKQITIAEPSGMILFS